MLDLPTARAAIAREMDATIALLDEHGDAWDNPTRLAGWTVADLAAHLVFGQRLQASAFRNLLDGRTSAVATASLPDSSQRDDVLAQLRAAAASYRDTLTEVNEGSLGDAITMPYGTFPAMAVLQTAVLEAGTHHSDVRAALGQDDRLADDVAISTAAIMGLMLPMLGGSATERPPEGTSFNLEGTTVTFDVTYADGSWQTRPADVDRPAAAVCIAGDDSDILLFTLGRRDIDARLRVTSGDEALARRFKSFFPGP